MGVSILTVCSGNICRSPLAEQLLRQQLHDLADVTVASAGTIAMVGHAMTPQAQKLSAGYGATDASAHVARQLTAQQIIEADLVLALSREHRRAIVEMVPSAVRKTFTLREFARLTSGVGQEDLVDGFIPGVNPITSAVGVASSFRGIVAPAASPDDDDVIDPYRQSDAVYQTSANQLVPAVRSTVAFIQRAMSVS